MNITLLPPSPNVLSSAIMEDEAEAASVALPGARPLLLIVLFAAIRLNEAAVFTVMFRLLLILLAAISAQITHMKAGAGFIVI